MTVTDTKRLQLLDKLKEMFQMDQADLDFGINRIMNTKRAGSATAGDCAAPWQMG